MVSSFCVCCQCFVIDFRDRILWLENIAQKRSRTFLVTERVAYTQRRPRNRLIGAWELRKESLEKCRTNCNECRNISSGSPSTPSYPSRNESFPQSNRNEVTYTAGGAEESDVRSVRKEERPELENLVVLGKGLRWSCAFSTETGNEECRKKRAADLRVEPSRLWRVERNGPRVATFLNFQV